MRTPLISRIHPAAAAGAILLAGAIMLAAGAAGAAGASVTLKKDTNGLFLLTINDADGIKSFSLVPQTQGPYGGEIPKCPRTFQSANVLFTDPVDFKPFMAASITDCRGNTDELEIPPPEAGATKSRRPKPPAPPPAPVETPAPEAAPAETAAPVSEQTRRDQAATEEAKAKVSYPVAELGDCGSEAACQAYCEELGNIKACIAYAEAHGLVTAEEAAQGRKFADIGGKGPGGCTSRESCAAFCEDVSRIEECLDFAEKNDFLSGKELAEVRAVAKVKKDGLAFPGGCTSKASCEAYCQDAGHMDECLAFGEASGLIPADELAMAKKMLPLIKAGKTPGGCKNKASCEAFCGEAGNMRQCLTFAEEQGLIPPEELEMAKKFMPLMERGETPGGCTRKETCEAYCGEEGHMDECIDFGVKSGFMSEAEAEIARKSGGKGPGDCRSKEACEAFCQQPENQDACATFAQEHGLEAGGPGGCKTNEECTAYCQDHPEECQGLGPSGGGAGGFSGPGGCTNQEQCMAYCTDHPEECQNFAPPGGGGPGGGPGGPGGPGGFPGGGPGGGFPGGGIPSGADYVGPGGCRTPEECIRYCKEPGHEQECNEFKTPSTTPRAPGRGPGGQSGGPGGCASVEECREYCNANQQVCDDFVSEDVPPEGKCQAGFQIERDALGYKYCNPLSCPEGQEFITDVFGRRACSPTGIPSGSGGLPSVPPGGLPTGGGMPGGGFPGGGVIPPSSGFPGGPGEFPGALGGFPAVPGVTPPQIPGAAPPGGASSEIPITSELCASFSSATSCSYIGPEGSQNYNLCVQCFPDRAGPSPVTPPSSSAATSPLGLILAPFVELFR